ncbi:MAG: cell division protein FtsZ, partial [Elusimicrobiaceae bacterium]|nr:cell division protein FtsZ [Elusimicrobiaceae bacterium]
MNDLFMPANSFESKKAKIKVIGVGGGGGNAINHMVSSGLKDVDFIAVNTDAQDLRRNRAPYLVQVGEKVTKGLGVGGDPERG